MRPLTKAGYFSLGISIILLGGTFVGLGGLETTNQALQGMISHAFWGGMIWAGLFIGGMALLFLTER